MKHRTTLSIGVLIVAYAAASRVKAQMPVIDLLNLAQNVFREIQEVNKANQLQLQVQAEDSKLTAVNQLAAQLGAPVSGSDAVVIGASQPSVSSQALDGSQLAANSAYSQVKPPAGGGAQDPYSIYLAATANWRTQINALRARTAQIVASENGGTNDYSAWLAIENESGALTAMVLQSKAAEQASADRSKAISEASITRQREDQSDALRAQTLESGL